MELREYIAMLRSSLNPQWHVVVMRLGNAKSTPQMLYIEPLGRQIVMDPDGEYDLILWVSDFNHAEIDYEKFKDQWPTVETIEQGLIVWLTRDISDVVIFRKGRPLWTTDVDLASWLG